MGNTCETCAHWLRQGVTGRCAKILGAVEQVQFDDSEYGRIVATEIYRYLNGVVSQRSLKAIDRKDMASKLLQHVHNERDIIGLSTRFDFGCNLFSAVYGSQEEGGEHG